MKKILSFLLLLSITFLGFTQNTTELNIGDVVSNFSATADTNELWKSSNLKTDFLVVYFYPAAMTSGCTKQACAYRDTKTTFDKLGVTVIGVSGDEVKNLKHFKESYQLNFPLLSDTNGSIAKTFGVPTKDGGSITRKINGEYFLLIREITTPRWTFVLDKNRKIIYKNSQVTAAEDSENVKDIIKRSSKK